MGRMLRFDECGYIYHIIQRGNNKEYIFQEEIDKGYLIKLIKGYKNRLNYRILGFVLMDNHYHIIMQPLKEKLQVILHRINSRYGKYYSNKYNHSGHVFQGRYKSILVCEEKYLLGLLRYVHQNPVKANMVKNIEDYKWSSDIFYRTNICKKLVDIDIILNMFSKNRKHAIIQYRKFMDEHKLEEEECYENIRFIGEDILNTEKKVVNMNEKFKSLEALLKETGITIEEYELIRKGSRKRFLTPAKVQFARGAKALNYTFKEIGEFINIKPESVYEMIHNNRIPSA